MFKLYRKDIFIVLILVLVALASVGDLISDLSQGVSIAHVLQEATILVITLSALAPIVLNIRQQKREIELLKAQLEEAQNNLTNAPQEVADARRQLAEVIREQFSQWALTPGEKEVGQCLLKGLSLKEVAAVRGTTEKTARQQASSIYQKADVAGRHAFSAWFIEDFL